jgi:hypothetical protein
MSQFSQSHSKRLIEAAEKGDVSTLQKLIHEGVKVNSSDRVSNKFNGSMSLCYDMLFFALLPHIVYTFDTNMIVSFLC